MLQGSENVVVVEYGIKLGGEKGEELVFSESYFKCDIDDNFQGKSNVYGINDGKRQGPEGEWLGSTYGSGQRIIFGLSELGMVPEATLGSDIVAIRGPTDMI